MHKETIENILASEVTFMSKAVLIYLSDKSNQLIPYSAITNAIKGSQTMIIKAIKALEKQGVLEVDRSDRAGNKYKVVI